MKIDPGFAEASQAAVTPFTDRRTDAAWYVQALNLLHQGVMLVDHVGIVRHLGGAASEILGYTEADLLGQTCLAVAPPEVQAQGDRFLSALFRQSPQLLHHWVIRRKDGDYLNVRVRFGLTQDANGETLALITFGLDHQTDPVFEEQRQRAERDAARRAMGYGMLNLVINSIPARIAYFGSQTLACVFANQSFAQAHRRSARLLPGMRLPELLSPHAWAAVEQALLRVTQGEPLRLELTQPDARGHDTYTEVDLLPHFAHSGTLMGIFWLDVDITAHRRVQHALRQSQEQLEQALQSERDLGELKTAFVSMASHELRTPLTVIQGSVDLLHYGDRLDAASRTSALADIGGAVTRMVAIMENILTLGRFSRTHQGQRSRTNLAELFREMADEVATMHPSKGPIVLQGPPDAGADEHPLLDTFALRHVLANLLGNACKYSPAHSPVTLRWCGLDDDQGARQLQIDVIDAGIGIPDADQPRLFESFFRASNVGNITGTGLGLPIARRAVESIGGTLSVESALGHGSRFRVTLPWQS